MSLAKPAVLVALAISLTACGTVRRIGEGSVAAVKRTTSATVARVSSIQMPSMPDLPDFSLAGILPHRGPKVVEVREQDLKDMPTGQELARNYQSERRGGFWIFGGPVDFKEPSLPQPGADLDGSLLPPRMP